MSQKTITTRTARFILLAVLILSIMLGTGFGLGYARARIEKETAHASSGNTDSDYSLQQNGYSGSSGQALLSNPLISGKVAEATKIGQKSVVVIVTRVRQTVNGFFGQSYVQEASALGSGVFFKEDDEKIYILTNAHVLADASEGYLYFSEEEQVPVYLIGESVSDDLGVIYAYKKDFPEGILDRFQPAVFGSSSDLRLGDLAIAIGSPYSSQLAYSTTVGIITGLDMDFSIDDATYGIQTDAALNPGNSGGALVNEKGEVIGINSAGIRDGEVEGIGFAIPIDQAKQVIDDLFSGSESGKATLGIQSALFITDKESARFHVPGGLYLYTLEENSPAEKAGLKAGDVIVSADGVMLKNETSLDTILESKKPGDTLDLEVIRSRSSGVTETVSVVLGAADTKTTGLASVPANE